MSVGVNFEHQKRSKGLQNGDVTIRQRTVTKSDILPGC